MSYISVYNELSMDLAKNRTGRWKEKVTEKASEDATSLCFVGFLCFAPLAENRKIITLIAC